MFACTRIKCELVRSSADFFSHSSISPGTGTQHFSNRQMPARCSHLLKEGRNNMSALCCIPSTESSLLKFRVLNDTGQRFKDSKDWHIHGAGHTGLTEFLHSPLDVDLRVRRRCAEYLTSGLCCEPFRRADFIRCRTLDCNVICGCLCYLLPAMNDQMCEAGNVKDVNTIEKDWDCVPFLLNDMLGACTCSRQICPHDMSRRLDICRRSLNKER